MSVSDCSDRRRSSGFGSMRVSTGGGSTHETTRVPEPRIVSSSGSKRMSMRSITRSHSWSARTAAGAADSPRPPSRPPSTAPRSLPPVAGRSTWSAKAPSSSAAAAIASAYARRSPFSE
jgi:hypothetical protein